MSENKQPSFETRDFRSALGCYPTGVIVMTGLSGSGEPIGLTMNSFTSVSLEPPLVSVCIARSASSFTTMDLSLGFVLNMLRDDQSEISGRFATSGPDKWQGVDYRGGMNDLPVLVPNMAALHCTRYAEHDGGDHLIVIGRVEDVEYDAEATPLVFHKGSYPKLTP